MRYSQSTSAPVFNIQSYCIHDGPGIRSTIFVKGCPLKCVWCHNPESNSSQPELMEYGSKCTGCAQCVDQCENKAISIVYNEEFNKYIASADRKKCTVCGKCVTVCPNDAREIAGEKMSAMDAYKKVSQDKMFYDSSNGGVTISGGEIMLYPEFCCAVFELCHENGISTAIESSMFASIETIEKIMEYTDLVICDIKHMDSELHEKYTGVGNEKILENIKYVRNVLKKPMIVRTPVVPGMNGDVENISKTAEFIAHNLGKDTLYQLLPYHNLGESKLESLGRPEKLQVSAPDDELMNELKYSAEKYLDNVQIGGD